ncbi:MAG: hypothetical protein ACRDQA_15780 [Nocardioidaceae bacterium]
MTRLLWRRIGPWLTPALVALEVGLVWSGLLSLRAAVVVGVVVEALLWVTVLSRVWAGLGRYRADRSTGADVWQAVEAGLARVLPRKFARLLLVEPRMLVAIVQWVRRRGTSAPRLTFRYDQQIRPLTLGLVLLVVVEGAALESVLALALPGSPWVWVTLGLHVYGVVWLLGFHASIVTRPHRLTRHALHLYDGVFTELVVPRAAVLGVRASHISNFGRSGLKTVGAGEAVFALGDATVTLTLDPRTPVLAGGEVVDPALHRLHITVDDAPSLVRALTLWEEDPHSGRLRSGSRPSRASSGRS